MPLHGDGTMVGKGNSLEIKRNELGGGGGGGGGKKKLASQILNLKQATF